MWAVSLAKQPDQVLQAVAITQPLGALLKARVLSVAFLGFLWVMHPLPPVAQCLQRAMLMFTVFHPQAAIFPILEASLAKLIRAPHFTRFLE